MTTIISGNTYVHKNAIKQLGFRWHPSTKTWRADSVSQDVLSALSDLRGLIISTGEAEIDTRTHKQKYGQCEDAPCCGCCGSHPYYG